MIILSYNIEAFPATASNMHPSASRNLSNMSLFLKTSIELAKLFVSVSPAIRHINLQRNGLSVKTGEQLAEAFSCLHKSVRSIDLSNNDLSIRTGTDLAKAYKALPESLKSLSLAENYFVNSPAAELVESFTGLSKYLKSLDISANDLGLMLRTDLIQVVSAFPRSLKSINLCKNRFFMQTGQALVLVAGALPRSLTYINLSDNGLHFSYGQLPHILAALPDTLTDIDLSNNGLSMSLGEILTSAFAVLSKSLARINLANNRLGHKSTAELIAAFTALPQSLSIIDLSYNNFDEKNSYELANIFAPLLWSNSPKQIILEQTIHKRLTSIFSGIQISPKSTLIFKPNNWYLPKTVMIDITSMIYGHPLPPPQEAQILYTAEALPLKMLTQNNSANLNLVMQVMFSELAAKVKSKQMLPENERLRPCKSLLEPTANFASNYVPELYFIHDLITRLLKSQLPLSGICAQIIAHKKLMPINFLMFDLAPRNLNQLILQLRTHEPIRALTLIEDLTMHLYTKSSSLAEDTGDFREMLINNLEWLKDKTLAKTDNDEIAYIVKKLKGRKMDTSYPRLSMR